MQKQQRSMGIPSTLAFALAAIALFGCGSDGARGARGEPGQAGADGTPGADGKDGQAGANGKDGAAGTSCTVTSNDDGSKTISCADGTSGVINNGQNGKDGDPGQTGQNGTSCSVNDNGDGSKTIVCTDGTSATVRDGAPGAASFSLVAEMPKQLDVTVKSVTIASPPVVEFFVTDAAKRGATGLVVDGTATSNLRFTFAKLVPGTATQPDYWQSYLNRASSGHVQATYERNGKLVDHGDGRYTYTFANDVTQAKDPVSGGAIPYDATLTHRLAIQLSGTVGGKTLPIANATFDFVPAGGAVTHKREIVATTSCNECHGTLKAHGSRVDTKYCVTCHNPGTVDASGNSGDFRILIHGIHSASYRKLVASQTPDDDSYPYAFAGQDFSDVTYPQALDNCLKCHDGANPSTPQGDNWKLKPTKEACTSCHAAVNLDTNGGAIEHLAGVQDNTTCATLNCHGSAKLELQHASEDATPHTPHLVQDSNGNPPIDFKYELKSATTTPVDANDATKGDFALVTFRILKNGSPLNIKDSAQIAGLSGGPSFLLAYATKDQDGIGAPLDYNNRGNKAAQPASVSIANLVNSSQGTVSGPDGDGYFVAKLTGAANAARFPAASTLRAVALQGYYTQLNFPRTGQNLARHAISVESPIAGDPVRRQVVDSAKCASCHEWFLGHGGNRVYAADVCVMCHVPNFTSSGRGVNLTTYPNAWGSNAHASLPDFDATLPLSWPEQSMSFKTLIHSTHASAVRERPFQFVRDRCSGSSTSSCEYYFDMSEVTFPGVLDDCETCHKPGTYGANLPEGLDLTTSVMTTGNDLTASDVQSARASVPNATDVVSTPVAAACMGCHDSDVALSHMEEHGAKVGVARSTSGDYVETCSLCHGPGRIVDVATVHMQ